MPGADENQEQQGAGAQAGQQDPAGEQGQGAEQKPDASKEMTPEEMKAEIAKLRKENASRRTAAKGLETEKQQLAEMMGKMKQALGIEDDKVAPEVQIQSLQAQNAAMELELGIREIAMNEQIPAEHLKYFGFLFRERLEALQEGEELDEGAIVELVGQVKGLKPGTAKSGTGGPGAPAPTGEGEGQATAESFSKMTIYEKSALHEKNPALYNRLFQEAKQKRLL